MLLSLLILANSSYAQQLFHTNFANQNRVSINPAFTGTTFNFDIIGGQRLQWVGVDGAPSTTYLSATALVKNTMGLGGNVVLDRAGMYNHFSSKLNYAYHIEIDKSSWISFGLGLGFLQSSLTPNGMVATDYSDELIQGAQGGIGFDADFGAAYFRENARVGVAIAQLLQNKVKYRSNGPVEGFGLARHINLFGAFDIELSEKLKAAPSLAVRTVPKMSTQFDLGFMVTHDETIWTNFIYRQGSGFIIAMGTHYNKKYLFGFSYELPMFGMTKYGSGSYEVYLGYRIRSSYKEKSQLRKVAPKLPAVEAEPDTD